MKRKLIIAVDFDGTIVDERFPDIGEELPNCFSTLKRLKTKGHKLILWTCRADDLSNTNGRKVLTEAVEFCKSRGLEFDGINANIPELGVNPLPKIYADYYIDDRNLFSKIDWFEIETLLSSALD
jgi:hypothetical protein